MCVCSLCVYVVWVCSLCVYVLWGCVCGGVCVYVLWVCVCGGCMCVCVVGVGGVFVCGVDECV